MCGIAGKLYLDGQQPVAGDIVNCMLEVIAHRGPDGQGVHLDGPVGLGHRRLSIIDLSSCGAQPMCNENGTVWITFNGEIYNYLDLREQLVQRGHVFRSTTDTEVIIHLYEEHGMDCLQFLRGMFAFAIWDKQQKRLFLARDRVGIKPLYYSQSKDAFWFASELKSILTDPAASREINQAGVRQFLTFYFPAGEATLFRSVKKLLPGHYIVVERGEVRIKQYWDLKFSRDRWSDSFEEVVTELQELLGSTVREHMIADVPVGVLLSGGMDSSAVLNFAVQSSLRKVKTFTVGFDDAGVVDERPYARAAARLFGTEHYDLSITADDFWRFLPEYVWHMEEPVCEPPAVALYYVSKFASKHVKVLLSGEGGDEAFGGYSNYPNMLLRDGWGEALGPLARPLGSASAMAGRIFRKPRLQRYGAALGGSFSDHYYSRTSGPTFYFNEQAKSLYTNDFLAETASNNAAQFINDLSKKVTDQPRLNQMLYIDTKTWLPDDLLIKADKITMANSIELRVPLLDHRVLEFAASLPPHYKVSGKQTKRVLKAAFAQILPPEILNRKKAGFPVPYDIWLRNGLAGPVKEILLSERARSRGYFNTAKVEHLLASNKSSRGRYAKEVFSLLVLELWHRAFAEVGRKTVAGMV